MAQLSSHLISEPDMPQSHYYDFNKPHGLCRGHSSYLQHIKSSGHLTVILYTYIYRFPSYLHIYIYIYFYVRTSVHIIHNLRLQCSTSKQQQSESCPNLKGQQENQEIKVLFLNFRLFCLFKIHRLHFMYYHRINST